MNKEQLVAKIAEETGNTQKEINAFLNSFINTVHGSLVDGDNVQLIGFGNFTVTEKKATTGRNPRTGEKINIPAKKVVKFVVGKKLKEAVAGS